MQKWSITALVVLVAAAIWAKIKAAGDRIVPVGYQDEEGFHTGEQPSDEQWPPSW